MTPKKFLITGCSTGIGEASALSLVGRGFTVFAGVRKQEDAEKLKAAANGNPLIPVILDVTSDESINQAFEKISGDLKDEGLAGLVNNAGIVIAGPQEFLKIQAMRKQLETNVISVFAMTQVFLPLIRKGKGRIVNMGSLSGLIATPFTGPYAASKFALRGMTDSLRLELSPWKIPVSLIEPGPIATPIWDKSIRFAHDNQETGKPNFERFYKEILEKFETIINEASRTAVPVERVVKVMEHALLAKNPRAYYPVGRAARFQAALSHLLPQPLLDKVLAQGTGLSKARPPKE